jgi:hypothetical protein
MQRYRFPIAVALTSLALVIGLVGVGGLLVGRALASSPFAVGLGNAGPPLTWAADHGGWQGGALPPELTGLKDVPPAERFAHFRGVQLQLTDKNNQPVTVSVTPGTATAVSPTSVTVAANDGSTQTFAIDANTFVHTAHSGSSAGQTGLAPGQDVMVVTLNGNRTATAVVAVDPTSMGPHGPFGH